MCVCSNSCTLLSFMYKLYYCTLSLQHAYNNDYKFTRASKLIRSLVSIVPSLFGLVSTLLRLLITLSSLWCDLWTLTWLTFGLWTLTLCVGRVNLGFGTWSVWVIEGYHTFPWNPPTLTVTLLDQCCACVCVCVCVCVIYVLRSCSDLKILHCTRMTLC